LKLNKYLYSQLSLTFFPIFLGLFFITSVVFLVRIVSLTDVITINFFELFKLYSYNIPQILIYTLPICFFISLVISISKLSSEYEITVITSFGISPAKIIKAFLPITFFVCIGSFVVSVGLIPKASYVMNEFIFAKKLEANFNIKESEFGQKFGEWLIFIESKENNVFKNIKLLNVSNVGKEQFIIAKQAYLDNEGYLIFKLLDGKIYMLEKDGLTQVNYEKMYINELINDDRITSFTTSLNYWILRFKNDLYIGHLIFYILTSVFPLVSLFLVVVFGYFNPRYEKNRAVAYSIFAAVIYYVFVRYMQDRLLLHTLYIVPTIWIVLSYILYAKSIKKEY